MTEMNHIEHYANALFSIWKEEEFENQKIITRKAKEVYFSLKENNDIIEILSSNILDKNERKKIIDNIFLEDLSQNSMSIYLLNFLNILIDNNFFENVLWIMVSFFEKIDIEQNFTFLRIFSPYWLDGNTLKKIESLFAKKTNKKIRYENMIDKSLIGGIKICFENQVYDYSIKGHINQIKWDLTNKKEG